MNALYLTAIIMGVALQNIIKKPYTRRMFGRGAYLFSLLSGIAAMLFFMLTSKGLEWNSELILYSLGFAVSYAVANVFSVEAVSHGPLSLSSLVISYSLMIPTAYGLIFLKDSVGDGFAPGIALLAVSLFLINCKSESASVTPKWMTYVFLAFLGNGMCSVIQKMQQKKFDGAYKNEFMILSLAISSALLLIFVITKEGENAISSLKTGWHMAFGCGVANGLVNLLVMVLSGRMPVSLMFPLISAGGIVITYIVSRFIYKEKMTKIQYSGFIIGIFSIMLLNV